VNKKTEAEIQQTSGFNTSPIFSEQEELEKSGVARQWLVDESAAVLSMVVLSEFNLSHRWIVCLGSKTGVLMTLRQTNTQFNSSRTTGREVNHFREGALWYAVQVASGCEKRVKTDGAFKHSTLLIGFCRWNSSNTSSKKSAKMATGSTQKKFSLAMCRTKMMMDDDSWQVVKKHLTCMKLILWSRTRKEAPDEVVTSNHCR